MIDVLMNTVMDDKDLKIVPNLYWNQLITIKIHMEEETNAVNIL